MLSRSFLVGVACSCYFAAYCDGLSSTHLLSVQGAVRCVVHIHLEDQQVLLVACHHEVHNLSGSSKTGSTKSEG